MTMISESHMHKKVLMAWHSCSQDTKTRKYYSWSQYIGLIRESLHLCNFVDLRCTVFYLLPTYGIR